MTHIANISDEILNAFVDDELDAAEKSQMIDMIQRDEKLRERACELRGLKVMVQHAYAQLAAAERSVTDRSNMRSLLPSYMHSIRRLAACVLLFLVGGISGWFMATKTEAHGDSYVAYISRATNTNSIAAPQSNIVFQVSTSNPIRLKAALDEAENLLEANRKVNGQFKVEFIANSDGVDLLRADTSPYGKRIGLMKAKYPNLDFLACNQTISKLQDKGIAVHLLPNTGIAPSAVGEISERLHQGWDYARM